MESPYSCLIATFLCVSVLTWWLWNKARPLEKPSIALPGSSEGGRTKYVLNNSINKNKDEGTKKKLSYVIEKENLIQNQDGNIRLEETESNDDNDVNSSLEENEGSKEQDAPNFLYFFEELKEFSKKYGLEDVNFLKDLEFFDGKITFNEGSEQENFVNTVFDLELNDFYRYITVFCVIAENMGMLNSMYRHNLSGYKDDNKIKIEKQIGSNIKIKKEDLKKLAYLLKNLKDILSKEKGFRYTRLLESEEMVGENFENLYKRIVNLVTACRALSEFFGSCPNEEQVDGSLAASNANTNN